VFREQPRSPQPTVAAALGAFDLDHLTRVAHRRTLDFKPASAAFALAMPLVRFPAARGPS